MNNGMLLIGLGAVILLGLGAWALTSKSGPTQNTNSQPQVAVPQARTFDVAVAKRALTPNVVTVTQGDQVSIKVSTDETGEFHVSGYDIENDMEAGKILEFSFTADKAGRYNFELHPKAAGGEEQAKEETTTEESAESVTGEDLVIGAFVVNPR